MEYIDGFTQEKQTNTKKCNGCKIGCKIDAQAFTNEKL